MTRPPSMKKYDLAELKKIYDDVSVSVDFLRGYIDQLQAADAKQIEAPKNKGIAELTRFVETLGRNALTACKESRQSSADKKADGDSGVVLLPSLLAAKAFVASFAAVLVFAISFATFVSQTAASEDYCVYEKKSFTQILLGQAGSHRYVTDLNGDVTYHGPLENGNPHGTWTQKTPDGEVEIEFTRGFYYPYSVHENAKPHSFSPWQPRQDLPWDVAPDPELNIATVRGGIQKLCNLLTGGGVNHGATLHGS